MYTSYYRIPNLLHVYTFYIRIVQYELAVPLACRLLAGILHMFTYKIECLCTLSEHKKHTLTAFECFKAKKSVSA